MKDVDIIVPVTEVQFSELDPAEQKLVSLARQSYHRAYAPYSHFKVGAAILLDNGETVCGSNQENAAYPSGLCAERTAAFYAHSQYPDARFVAIAVAAEGTDGQEIAEPISPCGACRQALVEYEDLSVSPVKVILVGRSRILILPSIHSTLPLTFDTF